MDQVVVIGYGVQKKSDLTGAIASVDADEIAKLPATNVMHAIQGKAAGVEIVQNSGAPGASSTVRIRGMGTINNSDPKEGLNGFLVNFFGIYVLYLFEVILFGSGTISNALVAEDEFYNKLIRQRTTKRQLRRMFPGFANFLPAAPKIHSNI